MTPIITVKEARKILGTNYNQLPDAVILQIIAELDFVGDIVIPHLRKEAVPKYTVDTSKADKKGR